MPRVHDIGGHGRLLLEDGWELCAVAPGKAEDPGQLDALGVAWTPVAKVPGTAASALRARKEHSFATKRDFDAEDFWFRVRFDAPSAGAHAIERVLRFEGLATLADVFLNGAKILASDDMFVAHEVDVGGALRDRNELCIRFASVGAHLAARRPRPRWKTRLVANQQLRWVRTTLLGRIPGWSPPVAPVGPWRPIALEDRARVAFDACEVRPRVDGRDGVVEASFRVRTHDGAAPASASIVIGDERAPLEIQRTTDGAFALRGAVRVKGVALWWPHTHGAQPRYAARVIVDGVEGSLGKIGFRTIEVDTTGGGFALRVNGAPVFCRGACWTTLDVATLAGDDAAYAAAIAQMRDAGMNMVRVGGTMVYEADAFYEACDALGVLVWQDFMFANMDYPAADERFVANVRREATQIAERLQARPSLAVWCGNSEIEQQVAMLGLPREQWSGPLFQEVLPEIARAITPGVPYVASSPTGGVLPFQVDEGISHYYGVGAYQRPLEDARRAGVRFTTECLAFANVPDDATIEALLADGQSPFHHPIWKERVPRDSGPGWDFDDVRDFYVKLLFGVDPAQLRYSDVPRYLALGRVATGEVMAATIGEWRRAASTCNGALVWLYRDLWPGAGWGVVDAHGRPKAAWWYLRRAMQPIALFLSDEGLNGLELNAVNDSARAIDAEVRLALYRHGETKVGEGAAPIEVPARGAVRVRGDALFAHFVDTTWAYRFGPPGHDVAVATMIDRATGAAIGEAFHFPLGLGREREADLGVEAIAEPDDAGGWRLRVRARRFAQSVAIDLRDYAPSDAYFHVAPGAEKTIALRPLAPTTKPPQGTVAPLNAHAPTKIVVRAAEVSAPARTDAPRP